MVMLMMLLLLKCKQTGDVSKEQKEYTYSKEENPKTRPIEEDSGGR